MSRAAALVTGGAVRIGRAIGLALAGAGFDVAIHYGASREEAEATARELQARGARTALVQADLADAAAVASLTDRAREALGPLCLVVNNASRFDDDRAGGLKLDAWDRHMAINLRAPVMLAQAFAAQVQDGADAQVINILDQRVLKPNPQFFSYTVSKSALFTATKMLAQALAPRVRVNGVGPGPTLPSIHQTPDAFAAEARNIPLQRPTTPQDVAAAVLYLVQARSVTGQMIAVDGGQHLAWRTPDIVQD